MSIEHIQPLSLFFHREKNFTMFKKLPVFTLAFLLLLGMLPQLQAQVTTANIRGTVTDASAKYSLVPPSSPDMYLPARPMAHQPAPTAVTTSPTSASGVPTP